MHNINRYFGAITVLLLLISGSCKNSNSNNSTIDETDSSKIEIESIQKAKSIFYQMYLPSEMYKVFEKAGAIYDPEILNPVENVNKYATSVKAAVNLGVYGVDMSYNKIFSQSQRTLLYFSVIHKLSQQLGIPDSKLVSAFKKMEIHENNKDSIAYYATEFYKSTSEYLNENERQATAALIIMGGWVESVYIASKIADDNKNNAEIIERIAFQKYSLRNIISILNNYQTEDNVENYLVMLRALNKSFEKFEIYYEPGDLNIDTVNKMIKANKVKIDLSPEGMAEIKQMIYSIRSELVN